MPVLTLHRRQLFKLAIPYWVFVSEWSTESAERVNECPVGVMQSREVSIQMPAGSYDVSVRILFQIFRWRFHIGGKRTVQLAEGEHLHLRIVDKERWWNLLFDLDLVLWLAKLFFELPAPWDVVYEAASNGFFALWIIRIWFIRNRYFQLGDEK